MNPYHRIKDFHAARRAGVGASDIPILAGLSKRYGQTPLTLWREKTGRAAPFDGNERTEWGQALEPLVLRRWVRNHYGPEAAQEFFRNATRAEPVSSGPFKVKTEAVHPERNYCLSHADLLVDDERLMTARLGHIVEAKTSGFYAGKRREGLAFEGYDPEDSSQFGIPDRVFMQVQWQLYTYGVDTATVAVLIEGQDYREYGPVIFDPRHVEKSLALVERFWWHVEGDREPSPMTWGDVTSLYPDIAPLTAMVSGEEETLAREMIARAADIKARAKVAEEELEDIKNALGVLIGGNCVLTASDGEPLAKAAERSKESIGRPGDEKTPGLLTEVKKLRKKKGELTPLEVEMIKLDDRIRELGLIKVSSWREIRY